jgi:hypothetical protein
MRAGDRRPHVWLKRRLFGISPEEASFARRGFSPGDPPVQDRLEQIGRIFLQGYHEALEEPDARLLSLRLNTIEGDLRGFAFEGAGMALGLLDLLTPWRRDRLRSLLNGPGQGHVYLLHVGLGWALARLSRRVERHSILPDPLLRWLVLDGYGFHEGYFHWPVSVQRQTVPSSIHGYGRRAFDQGLGRSLWFVCCADPERIAAVTRRFAAARRADLWSGIGLASAYAGGVDYVTLEGLLVVAGEYHPQLAQGVAFAAKARERGGNPAGVTEMACAVICEMRASEAAELTDKALVDLPSDGVDPAYEVWRKRIQANWAKEMTPR